MFATRRAVVAQRRMDQLLLNVDVNLLVPCRVIPLAHQTADRAIGVQVRAYHLATDEILS